ncbi:hypothetical protein [Anatilimnocola floriformis]|uniref:hypothetical protein n=1 Tax=Anatilimnocola floriformis TaxID=2948575 RepID=UPI0020C3BF7B|nr:hypothetical protein [Anatilimnocola floriformis]
MKKKSAKSAASVPASETATLIRWHEPALLFTVALADGKELMCRLEPGYHPFAGFDFDYSQQIRAEGPFVGEQVLIRKSASGYSGVILRP